MPFIVCLLLFLFALGTAYAEDDADTLTVEGARYRLDGIDAPELDQLCLNADGEVYFCGRKAYRLRPNRGGATAWPRCASVGLLLEPDRGAWGRTQGCLCRARNLRS